MKFTKKSLRLYAVTDRSWLHGETLYEQVEKALKGGVTLVQLREKELSEADFEQEAKELLELCHKYNVNLIINDNVALAAKVGADGVHIGQSDMGVEKARAILGKEKIIGVTAKTVEQAKAAEAACSVRKVSITGGFSLRNSLRTTVTPVTRRLPPSP